MKLNNIFSRLAALGVLLIFICLPGLSTATSDPGSGETIQSFTSNVTVHKDSTVSVTENIIYDFGNSAYSTSEHHGIYRDIQYIYSDKKVNITLDGVTEGGVNAMYTTSKFNGNFRIKIGDPNTLVSGVKTYIIKYKIDGAFNYLKDKDELYWQVTGTNWNVPIQEASVLVDFNELGVVGGKISDYCYAGVSSSANKCQESLMASSLYTASQTSLGAHEGLTYAIGFPSGTVDKHIIKKALFTDSSPLLIFGGAALLIIGLAAFFILYVGRFAFKQISIVPQYEAPDDMTPLDVGVIHDSKVDPADISAEIINFAVNGYLKITKVEEKVLGFSYSDYTLTKLKEMPIDPIRPYETDIFNLLFLDSNETKISQISERIQSKRGGVFFSFQPGRKAELDKLDLYKLNKNIYKNLEERGYLQQGTMYMKSVIPTIFTFGFVGAGLLIGLMSGLSESASSIEPFFVFGFIAAFVISIPLNMLVNTVTALGAEKRNYIKGLKMYIGIAEKDRINFTDAPDKNPAKFEKLLPYAMVLGVEKQWAKQFEGIYNTNPGWYSDPAGGTFSPIIFASDMSMIEASLNSGFSSSASGSGGGGSAGGGGGGGGGGSW